jgi:predicted nucleic-acid-binding Zn-ribbon protein
MNERIRELAEQAGELAATECNHIVETYGTKLIFSEVFNQRFAELIVMECKRAVYSEFAEGKFMTVEGVYKVLNDHFKDE